MTTEINYSRQIRDSEIKFWLNSIWFFAFISNSKKYNK